MHQLRVAVLARSFQDAHLAQRITLLVEHAEHGVAVDDELGHVGDRARVVLLALGAGHEGLHQSGRGDCSLPSTQGSAQSMTSDSRAWTRHRWLDFVVVTELDCKGVECTEFVDRDGQALAAVHNCLAECGEIVSPLISTPRTAATALSAYSTACCA
jgi:hypothetical protein